MKISKQTIFTVLFIVSLIFVAFVGRTFDPQTGTRNFILTSNGFSHFRKGLDVSGGTRLVYKISYDKYEKVYTNATELAAVKQTIETIIMKNIDSRISKLGVSDYKAYVQKLDNQNYIVVEIGGIADLDQAKELIGKTLELEFKLQNPENPTATTIAARKTLAGKVLAEVKKDPDHISALLEGRMSENIYHSIYTGNTLDQLPDMYKNNPKLLADAEIGKVYGLIEGNYATIYPQTDNALTQGTGVKLDGYTMFRVVERKEGKDLSGNASTIYVFEDVFVQDRETRIPATDGQNILNGAYFKFANTSTSEMGEPVVVINLDDKGKEVFCNVTQANIQKPMAIFVGGNLLTAPNIQSKICGGTAEINGSFTVDSAKQLSNALNEGTLPAPLILMQEEKINPSLGVNALTGALRAGLAWLIAIMILLYCMYGYRKMLLTGIVLITFLTVLAAIMKLTDYALSLSGIAAIILSIGMWVDANILIYERLREELKEGKSIVWAIDTAKDRSRSAIRDGQISTGLIAFVLFSMGTNMFKGFGSMMIITMLLTLLFNVPLTKMLLHAFYDPKKLTK
ncbi:MAG: bifunctional preprotein translocase subunit SecD/SecF [uncultured bacterium (gcode 4)]|uniref:Bifunctional preprotein translocase subunit SecD/SecF n=1 Tax=uncultured bacterium (gcode 4) TaxID=1234023 RepID=K1X5E0_9BACT|nr:MAG: bifunctional preprotein translocase subunit SecD/SecF [uncultured bacterium (gcode 4)]